MFRDDTATAKRKVAEPGISAREQATDAAVVDINRRTSVEKEEGQEGKGRRKRKVAEFVPLGGTPVPAGRIRCVAGPLGRLDMAFHLATDSTSPYNPESDSA